MNRLEVCKKLEDRNLQCKINAVFFKSLPLYREPLVHLFNSNRIGHVAVNSTCFTWNPF